MVDDCSSDAAESEGELGDDSSQQQRIRGAMRYLERIRNQIDQVESTEAPYNPDSVTLFDRQICPVVGNEKSNSLPENFGRFKIMSVLGQGGFARVFLAVDPRLDREIALKIPIVEILSSQESKARFRREAKAAAILNHPNIVPVFEADQIGPVEYIASAFVDGPSLKTWLESREGPVGNRQAAQIVAVLADALEHAHQRGVIHRDLKPGNILIDAGERPGNPPISATQLKITDFGLAKLDAVDQYKTTEGAILGTPVYMSPEQARADQNVAAASDIYSLGVVLYELLTGKVPFESEA